MKYGGNAMDAGGDQDLLAELAELRTAGHAVILVHGGGPEIDEALTRRGVTSRRINGLRITEAGSLEIVEAVLCATANKRLVRACLQRGIPAVGISGEDGGLIRARRATSPSGEDLGFVGEISAIDPKPLQALLNAGFLPIVAPVAIAEDSMHAYNVNADTAAGAIAGALHADAYITLTNVERVLRDPADPTSAIQKLSIAEAGAFARSDGCASGMKPKILAAIEAVSAGVTRAYICSAKPGAIAAALAGHATVIA